MMKLEKKKNEKLKKIFLFINKPIYLYVYIFLFNIIINMNNLKIYIYINIIMNIELNKRENYLRYNNYIHIHTLNII